VPPQLQRILADDLIGPVFSRRGLRVPVKNSGKIPPPPRWKRSPNHPRSHQAVTLIPGRGMTSTRCRRWLTRIHSGASRVARYTPEPSALGVARHPQRPVRTRSWTTRRWMSEDPGGSYTRSGRRSVWAQTIWVRSIRPIDVSVDEARPARAMPTSGSMTRRFSARFLTANESAHLSTALRGTWAHAAGRGMRILNWKFGILVPAERLRTARSSPWLRL